MGKLIVAESRAIYFTLSSVQSLHHKQILKNISRRWHPQRPKSQPLQITPTLPLPTHRISKERATSGSSERHIRSIVIRRTSPTINLRDLEVKMAREVTERTGRGEKTMVVMRMRVRMEARSDSC